MLAARVEELEAALEAANAGGERVAGELASVRAELATTAVSRDAAISEAGGLRAELERLGGELALARRRRSTPLGEMSEVSEMSEVGEAEALLAEARALREQMSERASRRSAATQRQ